MNNTSFTIEEYQEAGADSITSFKSNKSRMKLTFIPRDDFNALYKESKNGKNILNTSGIYCLVGHEYGALRVYIGKADKLGVRMRNHYIGNERIRFWKMAIVITSATHPLSDTDIRCLEHYILKRSQDVRHYTVHNRHTPTLPNLSASEKADIDTYVNDIRRFLFNKKHQFLEVPAASIQLPTRDPVLSVVRRDDADATGYYDPVSNIFIVKHGSKTESDTGKVPCDVDYFESLVKTERLVLNPDGSYTFATDVEFLCPTQAASIVLRETVDGYEKWQCGGNLLHVILTEHYKKYLAKYSKP